MILTVILIVLLIGFSVLSLVILFKWKELSSFILVNIALCFVYMYFYLKEFDANSFGYLFKGLMLVTFHSLLIFIFSICFFLYRKIKFNNGK